jgi:enoyl-CoA hydratase
MSYQTIELRIEAGVATVALNRPQRANAFNRALWDDVHAVFLAIDKMPAVRVVVLTGNGKHFCAGIDLDSFSEIEGIVSGESCRARAAEGVRQFVLDAQAVFNAVEHCSKPVIGAIAGACIGAGVDLATACDLRYSTRDARFCLKEIDMAIVADVGAIQRLPALIGDGRSREMIYTGREVLGEEAVAIGLVNKAFDSIEALQAGAQEVAHTLAAKSPLTLRGCKQSILYSREHSVEDSLANVALWNAGMLVSEDLQEAVAAQREKRAPVFRD